MKIAVTANGPNLDARVGHRFGTSPYIIFVDPETMIFEVEPNPGTADGLAAGIQLVVLAISKNIDAVLTDFASRLPGSTIVAKAWPLQPRQARLNGERTGPVEAAELKSWYIDLKNCVTIHMRYFIVTYRYLRLLINEIIPPFEPSSSILQILSKITY